MDRRLCRVLINFAYRTKWACHLLLLILIANSLTAQANRLFALPSNFQFQDSPDNGNLKPTTNYWNEHVDREQSAFIFKCPEQFGYYADDNDCTRYFVCVFGEPLHESCSSGLYFSLELQTCDWPSNVVCHNQESHNVIEYDPDIQNDQEDYDFDYQHDSPEQTNNQTNEVEDDYEESVEDYELGEETSTTTAPIKQTKQEDAKPRLNIVKKQLKDLEEEMQNEVDGVATEESRKTETKEKVITFVTNPSNDDYFNLRDLWNLDRKSSSTRAQSLEDRNKTFVSNSISNFAPNPAPKRLIDTDHLPHSGKIEKNIEQAISKKQNNIFYSYTDRESKSIKKDKKKHLESSPIVLHMATHASKQTKSNPDKVMLIYATLASNKTSASIQESQAELKNNKIESSECDQKLNCKLPNCFCSGTKAPNNLKHKQIPQMILLTFDGSVNDLNFALYQEIFERRSLDLKTNMRTNPNGCSIRGTFFVSHELTDYGLVQTLFAKGHEIASHSITHTFGETFTAKDWYREIAGQRQILHRFAGIPKQQIRGMRAPFLQIGGDEQFQMLLDANFTYDSSIAIFDNSPPYWPYTLDYNPHHDCMITPCPTKSYPGLWEIGLTMWQDLVGGGRCTMGSNCALPSTEQGVFELIMSNFRRHYDYNRAPFGLYFKSAWFAIPHHKAGFFRFVDKVLELGDVYFVTNWQLLQWMKAPVTLNSIDRFQPWQCSRKPPIEECILPNICHVRFRKKNTNSSRYFKTCQKCPTDYPWIDNIDHLLSQS